MGTINKLPPAPFQQMIATAKNVLSLGWSQWFKKLFEAVDANQQAVEDFAQGRQL